MMLSEKMIDFSEIHTSDNLAWAVLKLTGENREDALGGIDSLLVALEGTKKRKKIALAREAKQTLEAHFCDCEECGDPFHG
jgi:hypothetical protein